MNLILIEGVAGSGKSTLAEKLHIAALENNISASWYLEESKDHPVHPHNGKRTCLSPEYFLNQWENFISSNFSRNHLFILEGSFFQSTIRFMMVQNNERDISAYFKKCQSILAGASPKLIYLRPSEISPHIDWIMTKREEVWTEKVSKYLENTPFFSNSKSKGKYCMREFWSSYASLCDSLVSEAVISSKIIKSGLGSFENQLNEALRYTNLGQKA